MSGASIVEQENAASNAGCAQVELLDLLFTFGDIVFASLCYRHPMRPYMTTNKDKKTALFAGICLLPYVPPLVSQHPPGIEILQI